MRMCERIRQRGMNGALQTNGTTLNTDHMRKLVEMDWEYITCSIDGATEEVHDFIRGNGSFAKSTASLAQCAALRREMGARRPGLRIHTVLTRYNFDHLPAMVELAHRLGCDCVRAGLSCVMFACEHLITPEQHKALPESVERAKQRGRELGIDTDLDAVLLNPWGALFRREASRHDPVYDDLRIGGAYCLDPWNTLSVFADGRIAPCSMSWNKNAPKITQFPLRELWTGPYLSEIRAQVAENKPMNSCHTCPPILDQHTHTLQHSPFPKNTV
jgi:MoaA/NifB/PqqE/SkfB family radical SAM enzyme